MNNTFDSYVSKGQLCPEDTLERLNKGTQEVKNIITDFFGEDRVDFNIVDVDSGDIKPMYCVMCTIWYPELVISNEINFTHTIKDLYLHFFISEDSTINQLVLYTTRGTLTKEEYYVKYMHSHSTRLCINRENVMLLSSCCLGTSPLRNTILRLSERSNSSPELWNLFCVELDRYVHVESLHGGPYVRISELTSTLTTDSIDINSLSIDAWGYTIEPYVDMDILGKFLHWYLNTGNFEFVWCGRSYVPAMSMLDYFFDISDKFIEWYNSLESESERIAANTIIDRNTYVFINGKLARYELTKGSAYSENIKILRFKGKDVFLKIISSGANAQQGTISLVKPSIARCLLARMLAYINITSYKALL